VAFLLRLGGGTRKLIISFAWPYVASELGDKNNTGIIDTMTLLINI